MNLRKEWSNNTSDGILDRFYSREETVNEVIENFDIRRHHSAEGEQLNINGQIDWCLVQTSSNPLKELDDLRKIHCPMSMKVNRGDYVEYENDVWLIDTNVVNVGNAYQSTRMNRCGYRLKWQNSTGEIIERPVVTYNASAYNSGVEGNNTIQIGSDQLMILIPFDEETKVITRGQKFFIDNNMEDPMTYELTRPDRTTYVFSGTGYVQWLVTECAYTATEDDLKYGVCNYRAVNTDTETPTTPPENPDEMTDLRATITFKGSQELKIGGTTKTLTGSFVDSDGNATADIGVWEVITIDELLPYLEYTITDNTLKIKVLDTDLIDSKVRIMFSSADNTISTYLDFDVVSMF